MFNSGVSKPGVGGEDRVPGPPDPLVEPHHFLNCDSVLAFSTQSRLF